MKFHLIFPTYPLKYRNASQSFCLFPILIFLSYFRTSWSPSICFTICFVFTDFGHHLFSAVGFTFCFVFPISMLLVTTCSVLFIYTLVCPSCFNTILATMFHILFCLTYFDTTGDYLTFCFVFPILTLFVAFCLFHILFCLSYITLLVAVCFSFCFVFLISTPSSVSVVVAQSSVQDRRSCVISTTLDWQRVPSKCSFLLHGLDWQGIFLSMIFKPVIHSLELINIEHYACLNLYSFREGVIIRTSGMF